MVHELSAYPNNTNNTALMAASVWHCLDLGLLDGAEMLAEQLVASDPGSADAAFLHGLVLLRQGMLRSAIHAVSGYNRSHLGCIYIAGQAMFQERRWNDTIELLSASQHQWSMSPAQRGVSPAALYLLLGKCQRELDLAGSPATKALAQSVKLDPYLWENVALLVSTRGIQVRLDNLFTRFEDPLAASRDFDISTNTPAIPITSTPRRVDSTPRTVSIGTNSTPRRIETPIMHNHIPATAVSTPGPRPHNDFGSGGGIETPKQTIPMPSLGMPMPPPPLAKRRRDRPPSLSFRRSISNTFGPNEMSTSTIGGLGIGGIGSGGGGGTGGIRQSSLQFPFEPADHSGFLPPTHSAGAGLFERFATILSLVSRSSYNHALAEIHKLPLVHQHTATAIALRARCYMETCRFEEAAEAYRELRRRHVGRVRDMELYSTSLWHLKLEQELSLLAHDLVTHHRLAPESWCALGNAFSLQHKPEKALECFDRAIQIDPHNAYAYALRGHEHYANEDFVDALEAFQDALREAPSNANVWYGLGSVMLSLGDIEAAEAHYEQAIKLNPENAMLVCFLGMAFEMRRLYPQALAQYTRAVEMQPKSASARFKRAEALIGANLFAAAIQELKVLVQQTPSEASVHAAMGQAYLELGDRVAATRSFAIATDLDPQLISPLVPDSVE